MPAVLSEAQICNLALIDVGERQTIDSLNENTTAAKLCKQLYGPTRDAMLCASWWSFATKRKVLAALTEEREEWQYVYAAPVDMLEPQYLWNGTPPESDSEPTPFELGVNDAGTSRIIATDQVDAQLVYTFNLTLVTLFTAPFVEALAAALAVKLCKGLKVKPAEAQNMRGEAAQKLATAIASDVNSHVRAAAPDSPIILARGG